MATNRYDQRKNFEEGEANAIGTEILRWFGQPSHNRWENGTMVLKGNSVGNRICFKFGAGINELSGRGRQMSSQLEVNLRAALCRQLAKRQQANRALWMAEAENWSRLSKEKLRGEATAFPDGVIFTQPQPSLPERFGRRR